MCPHLWIDRIYFNWHEQVIKKGLRPRIDLRLGLFLILHHFIDVFIYLCQIFTFVKSFGFHSRIFKNHFSMTSLFHNVIILCCWFMCLRLFCIPFVVSFCSVLISYVSLFGISCFVKVFLEKLLFHVLQQFSYFPLLSVIYLCILQPTLHLSLDTILYFCLLSHYVSVVLYFSWSLFFICLYNSQLRRVLCQLSSVCSQFSWHLREPSRDLCPHLPLGCTQRLLLRFKDIGILFCAEKNNSVQLLQILSQICFISENMASDTVSSTSRLETDELPAAVSASADSWPGSKAKIILPRISTGRKTPSVSSPAHSPILSPNLADKETESETWKNSF